MSEKSIIESIVRAIDTNKGTEILVLDIHDISGFADYFVICNGLNRMHVQALSEHVEAELKQTHEELPRHIEGMSEGEWVLMDYGDIIIHIFVDEQRHYYNLEKLWGDAKPMDIQPWLV